MDLVTNGPNAHGGNVDLKSGGCGNRGAGEDWPAAGWWGLLGRHGATALGLRELLL